MKINTGKRYWILAALVVSLTASTLFAQNVSALYTEFLRRDKLRLNSKQGQAINFLKALKIPTEEILELEILDNEGRFLYRNRKDEVCLGDIKTVLLRCKNQMGLSTVLFQGDSD